MFDFQNLLRAKNKAPVSVAEADVILAKARQEVRMRKPAGLNAAMC